MGNTFSDATYAQASYLDDEILNDGSSGSLIQYYPDEAFSTEHVDSSANPKSPSNYPLSPDGNINKILKPVPHLQQQSMNVNPIASVRINNQAPACLPATSTKEIFSRQSPETLLLHQPSPGLRL